MVNEDIFLHYQIANVLLMCPVFAYRFKHNVLIRLQNYVMIFFKNMYQKGYSLTAIMFPDDFLLRRLRKTMCHIPRCISINT